MPTNSINGMKEDVKFSMSIIDALLGGFFATLGCCIAYTIMHVFGFSFR
jgi:hypothetical protein